LENTREYHLRARRKFKQREPEKDKIWKKRKGKKEIKKIDLQRKKLLIAIGAKHCVC
jgi:hypothetical protein